MERRFVSCFEHWIQGQKSDLSDLLRAANMQGATEMQLRSTIEQCMQSYENYNEQRKVLAREDGPTFVSPPWCTSFENSVLWIGGCRPSLIIRLLYSLTGCEMEAHLEEFLQGQRSPANVGLMNLTTRQLNLVNELHQRTLRSEDRLTSRQASLQEDVADKPIFPVVREWQWTSTATASTSNSAASSSCSASSSGNNTRDMAAALKKYADGMAKLVEEADALRLATAKTLAMQILEARQAIEMLIAAKQLHLSIHDWGLQRDSQRGRRYCLFLLMFFTLIQINLYMFS
jgi:Seed dormancy control